MVAEADFTQLSATVEAIVESDDSRQKAFRTEFDDYEAGDLVRFERTRAAIADQRELLAELAELLAQEVEQIEALADAAEYLSVDQAVRNREEALSKLRDRNDALRTFHDEVTTALDLIEANLDTIEERGIEAVEHDPDPHLQSARSAIEAHDEAVDELGKNLRILGAYMS